MAIKDVNNYYNTILAQYIEMKELLKALEEKANDDNSSSLLEQMDRIKENVNNLKENYERISYIMYLLNMPNKKQKKKRYSQSEVKRLDKIKEENRLSGITKENKEVLDYIGGLTDGQKR